MAWTATRRRREYTQADAEEWAQETVARLLQDLIDDLGLRDTGWIVRDGPEGVSFMSGEALRRVKIQGEHER